jgi:ankyrin repeat protein
MTRTFSILIRTLALAMALVAAGEGCFLAPVKHSSFRAIHGYARDGDVAHVTEDLAQNPGDLNLPDDTGSTPLHLAASYCRLDVVALLLDKGAKVNIKAQDGATPLHLAAQQGCADVVKLLLARHADVNARDKDHRTPLGRAEAWHQEAIAQILRLNGGTE